MSIIEKQPKGLFLLAATQMAESFSFHGMRVLLVLFLVGRYLYKEEEACSIYGLYTALIELSAFLGGALADRYLGLKPSVLLGGIFIALGHSLLSLSSSKELFFVGLGAIICGAALFRPNVKALAGCLYGEQDERRLPGFMLFYSASNLGGFSAALLCGLVATLFSNHAGFFLAAIGMGMSLFIFFFGEKSIQQEGPIISLPSFLLGLLALGGATLLVGEFLYYAHMFQFFAVAATIGFFSISLALTRAKMKRKEDFPVAIFLLGLLIIYFFFDELNGSFLMLFCENQVDRELLGMTLPSSFLAAANPLSIILLGPPLSKVLPRLKLSLFFQCSLSFLFLTLSLLILYVSASNTPSCLAVIASFSLIAVGELFLGPTVYSFFSEIGSLKSEGLFMGSVIIAFAVAKILSGLACHLYSPSDLSQLTLFFGQSTLLASAVCIALFSLSIKRKKMVAL